MNRPAVLFADYVTVKADHDGHVFVELRQGKTVVAVAGLKAAEADALAAMVTDAAQASRPVVGALH